MAWSPQQEQAIKEVSAWIANPGRKQVFYLAGFAGTGKTTLAKELASSLENVCFAAFTGKAALMLTGKGCPASTIHSLIYKAVEDAEGNTTFRWNPESPAASADLIVIDEVSMVGPDLGQDLLRYRRPILVLGDPGQLPPVSGEGFFTSHRPDFMLTEIHRQAADNPIIAMATHVRLGKPLSPQAWGASRVIERRQLGTKSVMSADQLLCGMNKTRRGLNAKVRKLMGREGFFTPKERVVALRNNSDKGLLNGSIWSVETVEFSDADESHLIVRALDAGMTAQPVSVRAHHAWLTGEERTLDKREARAFDPFDYAYCLSVHKAQGSQWDDVVVFDESYVFKEDRFKHLYTAITRAAERVTVVL